MKYIEPIGQRVLVRKDEVEIDELKRMDKVGLIAPDVVKHKIKQHVRATTGKVVAISQDLKVNNLTIGDTIFFNRWAGAEALIESEGFLILELCEIIGVLKEGPDPLLAGSNPEDLGGTLTTPRSGAVPLPGPPPE